MTVTITPYGAPPFTLQHVQTVRMVNLRTVETTCYGEAPVRHAHIRTVQAVFTEVPLHPAPSLVPANVVIDVVVARAPHCPHQFEGVCDFCQACATGPDAANVIVASEPTLEDVLDYRELAGRADAFDDLDSRDLDDEYFEGRYGIGRVA